MNSNPNGRVTIQSIFLEFFWLFHANNPVTLLQLKAAEAIMQCRTSKLGGHIVKCLKGHIEGVAYNSCKHRACPKCAFILIYRFIEEKQARLLNCYYYHCVFTIPEELNDLFRYNVEVMGDLLFNAAHETLSEFYANKFHPDVRFGMMASLHTWGRSLCYHPHLHILITAGGLCPDGWQHIRKLTYLLPKRAVAEKFRYLYLKKIKRGLRDGTIVPPPSKSVQHCRNRVETAFQINWHLRFLGPYLHGRGVVKYLSRYMRGGPVSNRQISRNDGSSIILTYTDTKTGERATYPLSVYDFIRRILWHVPPHRMRTFRMYGLFHPHCRQHLNRARILLGQKPYVPATFTGWSDFLVEKGLDIRSRCSECGAPLRFAQRTPRGAELDIPLAYKRAA